LSRVQTFEIFKSARAIPGRTAMFVGARSDDNLRGAIDSCSSRRGQEHKAALDWFPKLASIDSGE
jgi:hypothetical protein